MHLIIIILLSSFHILFHPVHVSITNINLNSELNTAELSFQFFTDDFIGLILSDMGKDEPISQKKDVKEENIEDVSNYIFSMFAIKINNETELSFDYKDKKQNEESIWIYYTGQLPKGRIETITLVNKLMLDLYPDQTNLVILDLNGTEKGYTFNYRKKNINVNL